MIWLPTTLVLLSYTSIVYAGSAGAGDACNVQENRLQTGTYQFYSECNARTFCNSTTQKCENRGCRREDFPFGYAPGDKLPEKCEKGQFCPDEEDACQPLLPVGSPCQLNRDDQCEAPPDFKELADTLNRGYNNNGSVCLNNICMWANVTLGQPCIVENTAYIAYGGVDIGTEFIDIVSRGNCKIGLYCDSSQKVCIQGKKVGEACGADKECESYNCAEKGVCDVPADTPNQFPAWVYVLVVVGILGGMFGTLFGLYKWHRRERDSEREKRIQYWREQNAFRQNIMQMRDTASSILGQGSTPPSQRSTIYQREGHGSMESQAPILQHAAHKASGMRSYTQDDSDMDDGLMIPISRRADGRF